MNDSLNENGCLVRIGTTVRQSRAKICVGKLHSVFDHQTNANKNAKITKSGLLVFIPLSGNFIWMHQKTAFVYSILKSSFEGCFCYSCCLYLSVLVFIVPDCFYLTDDKLTQFEHKKKTRYTTKTANELKILTQSEIRKHFFFFSQ